MRWTGLLTALAVCLAALAAPALAEDVVSAPVELAVGEAEALLGAEPAAEDAPAVLAGEDVASPFEIDDNGALVKYNGPGGVVAIPESVTRVGEAAFEGCAALEQVDVPGSVRSLGRRAFAGCAALQRVTLGEGLRGIDSEAFAGCAALEGVTLPLSLVYVEPDAFAGCAGVTVRVYGNHTLGDDLSRLADVQLAVLSPLPTALTLGATEAVLAVGQKLTIAAALAPEGADGALRFASSDAKVAKVSSKGVVRGVSAGRARVTVTTVNGIEAALDVTVKPRPTRVRLNWEGTVKLVAGRTLQLKATLSPKGALTVLTWKSSNRKIARVSSTGRVTALKKGSATITVTTANGKKDRVKLSVRAPLSELSGTLKQKLSAVNKKLGDPLKRTEWSDEVYENRDVSVSVDRKGRITSVMLLKTAKRYKLLGVGPGMTKTAAQKKLTKAGCKFGLRTERTLDFYCGDNKSGWFEFDGRGKVTGVFLALAD